MKKGGKWRVPTPENVRNSVVIKFKMFKKIISLRFCCRQSPPLHTFATLLTMLVEISTAVSFWSNNMCKDGLTPQQVRTFERELTNLLYTKFSNNLWHTSTPQRGSAARYDSFTPLLKFSNSEFVNSPTARAMTSLHLFLCCLHYNSFNCTFIHCLA